MKLNKFLYKLAKLSEKSDISHHHSAVLVKNGSAVCWGYNSFHSGKTVHAEENVIMKYIRCKTRGKEQCLLCR